MEKINAKIEELKDSLIKDTQEVLKIKSLEEDALPGMPYGEGVGKALEKALEISKALGFKTVNLDGYVGYAEYGQGEDYIAVLGHLDVVPEGDGWKYPPYGAEIHDGKIYARGAMDDKGPIMSALYGLKAVMETGLPLSKRVRIIFGTNEETGSAEIPYYNAREKAPAAGFTPDAQFPIIYAEKGLTIFDLVKTIGTKAKRNMEIMSLKGGQRPNMVPDYCEALIATDDPANVISLLSEFKYENKQSDISYERTDEGVLLKSYGVSAHGSLPELGKNAIMQLLAFLGELPFEGTDIGDFIKFCNENIGMETDGKSFGVDLEDAASGKLSFNVGNIDLKEGVITMSLNLRYPVTFKLEDMLTRLERKLLNTDIEIKNLDHQAPLYFPKEHPLIVSLQKVYKEQTGLEPELLAIGGGTYAKEMENIVAFGPIFPGKPDLDHQANEYIEIEDLVKCAKIYGAAIYELAK
ncbi:dipeptidase PepV [Clostridium polynesiense]|uniref:dipeptidase PepV n=1 Tax=Clostridium polynesiense TaxID=1325933 RepID=UPI00058B47EA|nr:dipeptidase PepV [Clostridium polynesiense]